MCNKNLNITEFSNNISDWIYIWVLLNSSSNERKQQIILKKINQKNFKKDIIEAINVYFDLTMNANLREYNNRYDFAEWIFDVINLNYKLENYIPMDTFIQSLMRATENFLINY